MHDLWKNYAILTDRDCELYTHTGGLRSLHHFSGQILTCTLHGDVVPGSVDGMGWWWKA